MIPGRKAVQPTKESTLQGRHWLTSMHQVGFELAHLGLEQFRDPHYLNIT